MTRPRVHHGLFLKWRHEGCFLEKVFADAEAFLHGNLFPGPFVMFRTNRYLPESGVLHAFPFRPFFTQREERA